MKVLIVEDSKTVAQTIELCISMRWPGTEFVSVSEGKRAPVLVETAAPDIVVLDLTLPDIDGLDLLREFRSFSDVPVLVVTARGDEVNRIRGLEAGADDYVVKPFSHTEFLARMNAVLRRTGSVRKSEGGGLVGDKTLSVDLSGKRVYRNGNAVELTPIEWEFVAYGVRNSGKVISHDRLAENVWGTEFIDPGAIKMCVYRLRQKLGDDSRRPQIIRSHRGMGYSLTIPRG